MNKKQHDIDKKIVASLERVSQVFRMQLWDQATEYKLSPIQIQFLVFVFTHPADLCTVSALANEFGITKPTASDAVHSLLEKGYLQKERSQTDRRIFRLTLTSKGMELAERLSKWTNLIEEAVAYLPDENKKQVVLEFLLSFIHQLQKNGLVPWTRMCLSCRYFEQKENDFYCNLMEKSLYPTDLRLDCPDHQLKESEK